MQSTWNLFSLLAKVPYIIAFIVLIYLFLKAFKAFVDNCFSYSEDPFFKRAYNFFDPYHQSIFCYKYRWYIILILIGIICLLCKIYIPPELTETPKGLAYPSNLFCNPISYFFNYIIHENLGHNLFGRLGPIWWSAFTGNFIETLTPCIIYLLSLQLRGGLLFSPVLLYWISTTFYEAGIYASDAATSKLYLTSSDMISDFAAGGSVKGDWYYILGPFNALDYAPIIGTVFEIIACIIFALALYSLVEYIRRLVHNDIGYDAYK